MDTSELRTTLEQTFHKHIRSLRRMRSPYSSSFAIEELSVEFDDGNTSTVIFKNLSEDAMLEDARRTKPDFVYAPEREIQVYQSLLPLLDTRTAKLYGAAVAPQLKRYWLFLEKVSAPQLYEIGEFEVWLNVAESLARLHESCDITVAQSAVPQLQECDAAWYWRWLERAHDTAGAVLDRIAAEYNAVVDILLKLPRTFIHGEFYPSNILVQQNERSIRICPVDWEMAAVGPGLLDVAALASGKWTRDERMRILERYCSILPPRLRPQNFVAAFDCCQLHIALQWIGWSRTWSPPAAHAHNWIDEAIQISKEGLASVFVE
jgi:phosphotransferase family enzyme